MRERGGVRVGGARRSCLPRACLPLPERARLAMARREGREMYWYGKTRPNDYGGGITDHLHFTSELRAGCE